MNRKSNVRNSFIYFVKRYRKLKIVKLGEFDGINDFLGGSEFSAAEFQIRSFVQNKIDIAVNDSERKIDKHELYTLRHYGIFLVPHYNAGIDGTNDRCLLLLRNVEVGVDQSQVDSGFTLSFST